MTETIIIRFALAEIYKMIFIISFHRDETYILSLCKIQGNQHKFETTRIYVCVSRNSSVGIAIDHELEGWSLIPSRG
jgi:hypothetical protein